MIFIGINNYDDKTEESFVCHDLLLPKQEQWRSVIMPTGNWTFVITETELLRGSRDLNSLSLTGRS